MPAARSQQQQGARHSARGKDSRERRHIIAEDQEHAYVKPATTRPPQGLALRALALLLDPSSALAALSVQALEELAVSALWPDVVAVVCLEASADAPVKCPLCLDHAKVARALPCGHVFCCPCLLRCMASDVGAQRCPICLNGETLARDSFRTCVMLAGPCDSFTLVHARSRELSAPVCDEPHAQFSRFQLASAARMMAIVHDERKQLREARADALVFRDDEGLVYVAAVDALVDDAHVRWSRALNKSPKLAPASMAAAGPPGGPSRYQRSNGAREFLHPLNLRILTKEFGPGALPAEIVAPRVLQVDAVTAPKLGGLTLPKNTLPSGSAARLVEIDMDALVSPAALADFSIELWRRAERRSALDKEATMTEEAARLAHADMADARRRAREEHDRQVVRAWRVNQGTDALRGQRDFFHLSEETQKELRESPRRSDSPPGSFAAVVSQGGFFPALPPSASTAAAGGETFTLRRMSDKGPMTPASADKASFASVLVAKPASEKKGKLLFSNNSASRRGAGA